MAIAFALLSLLSAAGLDLALKHRSRVGTTPGVQLLLIGLVWSVVSGCAWWCAPSFWSGPTLVWGLVSGVTGLAANLLLLVAMRGCEVGTCATVYRLNLVPATLLAVLALGETLTDGKLLALVLAVGAVLLMATWRGGANRFLAAAIAACALRALMALAYREGVVAGAEAGGLLVINGVVWFVGAAAWAAVSEGWRGRLSMAEVRWGLAIGLLATGSATFLARALVHGQLSQVLPISQLSFVVTALAACLLLGERLTLRKATALALAVGAIGVLITV